jgi:hypothetical protein
MPIQMLDSSKPVTVRVLEPFYFKGKPTKVGDVFELDPIDAHDLIRRNKAELAKVG